jgi:hypothetical protein
MINDDFMTAEAHARIETMLGEAATHRLLARAAKRTTAPLPARLRGAFSRTLHSLADRIAR